MFCLMKFLYAKTMKIKILKIINIFSSNTLEDSDIFLYPPLIDPLHSPAMKVLLLSPLHTGEN